ncbi:MAG: beta-ketoacyl synthase N-terminal-like domain-containing protein, partial [Myxococcota bacterium]
EVPAGRWPMGPGGVAGEAPSTAQGAFVDVDAPPCALDPLFGWVERVVRVALPDSADRERTSLALACLGLPTTGMVRAVAAPWLDHLGVDVPWLARAEAPPLLELAPTWGPARAAADALGLGGEVDALDAACASGLFALRAAVDRLASGEARVAVAAAANRADSAYLFEGFSRLMAMSRSGVARPFDERADGLVVGEGAVAVALKRLDDALRDGDPVHAVIRAVGVGSDGRKGNMLSPSADGQLRAMRAAWRAAGLVPQAVGVVECHATGTSLGDGTEVRALEALLAGREGAPVALSSAKALVGHTVTAAGLAGLLRAVGAVRDAVRPAAIGCERPRAEVREARAVTVLAEAAPWDDTVRRAAVSAFGFGGTNAHVVLEAFHPGEALPVPVREVPRLAIVAVAASEPALGGEDVAHAVTRGLGPARPGRWVPSVSVDPWRFKIPPVEVADILPQQLIALELAADAVARAPRLDPARTGAVLGVEVDPQVAEVVIRWALAEAGEPALADAVAPPLGSARVQGALPNFVACRVAAQLGLEGPSYAVAAGPRSGTQALRHAARLLADAPLDAVVVGAADLRGPRFGPAEGEAAVVLVVRRLADAEAAGDVVFAEVTVGPPAPEPPVAVGWSAADGLVRVLAGLQSRRPCAGAGWRSCRGRGSCSRRWGASTGCWRCRTACRWCRGRGSSGGSGAAVPVPRPGCGDGGGVVLSGDGALGGG